jgi:hypothetical protein
MATAAQNPVETLDVNDSDVKLESHTDAVVGETVAPHSKKHIIIERLILCTALFFPLFLATLDTSTVLQVM